MAQNRTLRKIPLQDLASDLEDWIKNSLSTPNPVFNMLPACPYAKKAWMDKRVAVRQCLGLDIFSMMEGDTWNWTGKREVIVYGFDPSAMTPQELSTLVEKANSTFLSDRGFVALEDHPHEIEEVEGVNFNQGSWALVLLQERAKLEEARQYLQSKGYYDKWPEDYKKSVWER